MIALGQVTKELLNEQVGRPYWGEPLGQTG